jgi:hypothetical protein
MLIWRRKLRILNSNLYILEEMENFEKIKVIGKGKENNQLFIYFK